MITDIIVLVTLLLCSAFFSASETALFSMSKTKARHLAKDESNVSKLIYSMKLDPHRLLATILIGNNVVNIGASSLATSIAINLFHDNAVSLATGVMTLLILIFGEVFPKSIATNHNIAISRLVIYPVYWLSIIFYPIVIFLNFLTQLLGQSEKKSSTTEEEFLTFVEVVEEEGEINKEEKELISNIIEFDDTNASEIMTPRADMFVIDLSKEVDFVEIGNSGFTRIPVIDGNIDNIIGILNIKDLFMHQAKTNILPDIKSIMTPPYFIPENKKLDKLLHQFKKRKHHIAIIIDEHGGVAGLITLEDVLEEIVGEISDETDKVESYITDLKNNEWLVLGKTIVEDVNKSIGIKIPITNDYDTISGYVLDVIARIPKEKEEINLEDFVISVKAMEGNRIKELIIKKK
ncbi:MAG: HlyC/CorC family transporter [Desulfobacterales bacterium]|nr:HlyC/CorC family transporter [Desulfobacterales bacterium]